MKHLAPTLFLIISLAALMMTACGSDGLLPAPTDETPVACVQTDCGNFYILLFDQVNPKTVARFTELAQAGSYDGIGFHRVEKGHVIQAGCPYWNDPERAGSGNLAAEFLPFENATQPHLEGAVGMARAQEKDSAGSQFYVCLAPRPHLDGDYVVFGQVIAGMEVVHQVRVGTLINHIELLTWKDFLQRAGDQTQMDPLGIIPPPVIDMTISPDVPLPEDVK